MYRASFLRRATTAFLTDAEGSMVYWNKYLAISKVLHRCPDTKRIQFTGAAADTKFVYGGDAFDKGGDDVVFAEELLQLKKDYPGRVTLIGGNRDLNKMNFGSLFTDAAIAALGPDPAAVPIPFFMAHDPKAVSYATYLQQNSSRFASTTTVTKLSYFCWRLDCTMGCKGLFDQRKQYLQSLQPQGAAPLTEADVMNHFLRSAQPGGIVYRYLDEIQIAAVIDGTLFVHGAINKSNAGFIPTPSLFEGVAEGEVEGTNVFARGGSVQEWVDGLNAFAAGGVKDWKARPEIDPVTKRRGGGYLAAYCHEKATRGKTVVIPNFTTPKKDLPLGFVDLGVVEHLNTSGVFRVCTGHKPIGEMTVTIQQPGLSVHIADNSYCCSSGADQRGEAVQEVLLDGAEGTARCHGRRADGSPFDFDLDHPLVGLPTPVVDPTSGNTKQWWSVAVLPDDRLLLHRTENDYFSVMYTTADTKAVEDQFEATPLKGLGEGEFDERYSRQELKPMKRKVPGASS
ncbi:Hypothetical protein, putative [Bodo saltans]|uniref:Calcineurin-like phosphoesterase domain-containing protein n=1 Tax=Bodo saltans TaxID=75058 RepID=A0A0S4J2Q8_BODSA|nr:Hypothetical protein, putative [Bodo saltans]|eukprot:CUG84676.1 Hypothetical protein, putative [Bodo saltans]